MNAVYFTCYIEKNSNISHSIFTTSFFSLLHRFFVSLVVQCFVICYLPLLSAAYQLFSTYLKIKCRHSFYKHRTKKCTHKLYFFIIIIITIIMSFFLHSILACLADNPVSSSHNYSLHFIMAILYILHAFSLCFNFHFNFWFNFMHTHMCCVLCLSSAIMIWFKNSWARKKHHNQIEKHAINSVDDKSFVHSMNSWMCLQLHERRWWWKWKWSGKRRQRQREKKRRIFHWIGFIY